MRQSSTSDYKAEKLLDLYHQISRFAHRVEIELSLIKML